MIAMKLPGFSAEASLYQSCRHYRAFGPIDNLVGDRGIQPQLMGGMGGGNEIYTTHCEECGCVLVYGGLACYCGPRGPRSPEQLDCLLNGPSKVFLL
jgi:hypothetical protein